MVNVLIKHLYEVSCWYKTTQFISHPFLMISRKIGNNQNRKYIRLIKLQFEPGIWLFIKVNISFNPNCLE